MYFKCFVEIKVDTVKQYCCGFTFAVRYHVHLTMSHERDNIKVLNPSGILIGNISPRHKDFVLEVMDGFPYLCLNIHAQTSY